MTASIGIADSLGGAEDPDTLVKNADMAMYRAKDRGGNTYEFHTAEMTAEAIERMELEGQIRRAAKREEFVLHFQPELDLRSHRIVAMEALVRWRHPDTRLVPPGKFIPIAEESGLIVPIGEWVLRTACQQARAWRDAGIAPMRIAVNLSARQFQDRGLAGAVAMALKETDLDPHWLELEVTEGLIASNTKEALETMHMLKSMGVRLSIDDFGTGYSSLAYLKSFPVDMLKIDRSFVRDVLRRSEDAAIAATVIELAHNLGLEVIAEGVESEKQLAWLRSRGCDIVQGFLISPPMSSGVALQWLRTEPTRASVAV